MRRSNLVGEMLAFLLHEKKWWMIPLFLLLAALALFILVFESPLAPLLYPLF